MNDVDKALQEFRTQLLQLDGTMAKLDEVHDTVTDTRCGCCRWLTVMVLVSVGSNVLASMHDNHLG